MRRLLSLAAVLCLAAALTGGQVSAAPPAADATEARAAGFSTIRTIDQDVCQEFYTGGFAATHFSSGDCIRVDFTLGGAGDDPVVKVEYVGPDGGEPFATDDAFSTAAGWRSVVKADDTWPPGQITARVVVEGQDRPAGSGTFAFNTLAADVVIAPKAGGEPYAPGDAVEVTGNIYQLTSGAGGANQKTGVAASFVWRIVAPDGTTPIPDSETITAAGNGDFAFTIPAEATEPFVGTLKDDFKKTVSVAIVGATYQDGDAEWAAKRAGAGSLQIVTQPDVLLVDNSFVSSNGWVKPGDTYPFRVTVSNFTGQDATGVQVTIPAPDGAIFTGAVPLNDSEAATVAGDPTTVTWNIGPLAKASGGKPTTSTLVVEARSLRASEDPEIVWKNISSTATLAYDGYTGDPITSESHGPKVIPVSSSFDTARYGDKPFPMVPVDYTDRKHKDDNTGDALSTAVNDPQFDGSTFNLYQEMSYGQLFPEGTVPSASIASAGFDYEPGFDFTTREPTSDCRGYSYGEVPGHAANGSPAYPERIVNGWYQLPGNTEYYGGDYPAFDLGTASSIDSACGQSGKAVYDGAAIADPEIDYNDYDSDKDGVVDFFMLVFVGCGGNGASQLTVLACPLDQVPYDNIWPHSSSLEMQYTDEETGLKGYISDDQLKSLEEVPQCWLDDGYTAYDDCAADGGPGDDSLPVFVRVGPYNVNPETAIDSASVISHEYGHHLGLPDFYSSESLYADMNLMAADYSQHMTIFSKQDLGWVVPEFPEPGSTTNVDDWNEIKDDTGTINWQTADGVPYTLSAENGDRNIHNGEAYGFKLPTRQLIDPKKVQEQTAQPGANLWYSERGNDFGCSPNGGHNLDLFLPELAKLDPDTPVTLTFKSSWDIEWDWDYGFVLTSVEGENPAVPYTSNESEKGYTTRNTYNPNGQQCFTELNNGLTGQSGAYEKGEPTITQSRNPAEHDYGNGSPFLEDEYDISELSGQTQPVVRFSYFTDAAFDRPGWFIDDVVVKAGDKVIYDSGFEDGDEEGRLFPGGCANGDEPDLARQCTDGWVSINAEAGSVRDHAYYLELRDQALFDYNGYGQSDRGDTSWDPGVLIEYTDETHGYGNNGVPMPPAQHYLDSQPIPDEDCGAETGGNCADASFTAADGDNHFDDSIRPGQPEGWIDNFGDPDNEANNEKYDDESWHFDYNCLSMTVEDMAGQEAGPAPGDEKLPADLTADATLESGPGCREMAYVAGSDNVAPTALAQAKPRRGPVGSNFKFDAGRSYDDQTALDALKFAWDFDGDGFDDGRSQSETHSYATAGTKKARVRVTDEQGLQSIDAITVQVTSPGGDGDGDGDGGGGGGDDDGGGDGSDDDNVGSGGDEREPTRDRDDGDSADRGSARTPVTADVGNAGGDRSVGAVANTGSAALVLFASALLALTAGAWLLLSRRRA